MGVFFVKKAAFAVCLSVSLFLSVSATGQELGCEMLPGFNEFDFWVGEWDVFDISGSIQIGSNSVQKLQSGCMISEKWTGTDGQTGSSLNYFNPVTNEWRYVWVSASRFSIDMGGGIRSESMLLEGSIYNFAGAVWNFRGTWTPNSDGSVRQFFEQYNHSSEQWDLWFDRSYKRK